MLIKLPQIYPITDVGLSSLSHLEQVRRLTDGGAELIQLRQKGGSSADFTAAATDSVKLAHARGCKIIINDRVDIALYSGADGVHLGQDDLPPDAARRVLGPDAIIGFSTHSVAQAIDAADRFPVDYIAIGPVFDTATKQDHDPVVGLEGLTAVRKVLLDKIPLVAIGGIGRENVRQVLAAGADAVAVISDLFSGQDNIAVNMSHLKSTARQTD